MSFHFCNCLNFKIRTQEVKPISDEFKKLASSWKDLNVDCLEFFRTAIGNYKAQEVKIYTEEHNLVQKLKLNNWIIHRCLNCDLFVYAVSTNDEYLLNGNLLHDEAKLIEMQSSDKYSLPFKIILKRNFVMGNSYGGHDIRYKQLFMKLEEYIANETANAEREIRQFTEQKLAELNYKREVGAKDYSMLVNFINSITDQQNVMVDCGNNSTNTFTNTNNNNHLTNNNSGTISTTTTGLTDNVVSSSSDIVDTPPITPESSTPMSIENVYISPTSNAASSTTNNEESQADIINKSSIKKQIPQQPQNANTKKTKEMSAKHSKLIHQQLTTQATKTFDFDEVFDMDGLTSSNRKATQPIGMMANRGGQSVKFAADYDDCSSDQDESMDRSDGVHIPRHGNKNGINIAKSAPIPMAQMPGRVDSDLEDEPENNIDIAASIKALARSVHGDTVFGDLPTRQRFTTQI